jgi:hypothetical protein
MIRERNRADLSVRPSAYFGSSPNQIDNLHDWALDGHGALTRMSYVFQAVYRIGEGANAEYGGIQLRARVHTYGASSGEFREILRETAHRAAHMYNSPIQTSAYVNQGGIQGTEAGSGYLDGFNPEGVYSNWETEQIPQSKADTEPGVVDWSVEVYEDDSFNHADLAGIAQGVSFPWYIETRHEPGRQSINIAPHKWTIAGPHDSRPDYYELRPPAHTDARNRYREGAGRGKRVYINGHYVGETDNKGRVWLKIEYARGDGYKYGEKYSREGLVAETGATYQAIRNGGTLYMTGETENRIDLVTAREKPDGFRAVDGDDVSVHQEVQEGRVEITYRYLRAVDPADSLECEARRDETITWALGKSNPIYSYRLPQRQRWEPSMTGDPNHSSWGGGGR